MNVRVMSPVVEAWISKHRSCPRDAQGSYVFVLACGHRVREKVSQGRPMRKRCRACEDNLRRPRP